MSSYHFKRPLHFSSFETLAFDILAPTLDYLQDSKVLLHYFHVDFKLDSPLNPMRSITKFNLQNQDLMKKMIDIGFLL